MSHSSEYTSSNCHALRDALRDVEQSDRDLEKWEWDEDEFPISRPLTHFYELYPYSRASHDPETEWGKHYRSLKWEIPEVNDWNLTMMDSKLDGSAVSRCTVSELKSVEIQLDKESRFRTIEYLDGLDKLDPTPEKMPKSVMQLLFTRYDISPKFLDLIVAGNGGSIMGVSQFESTTKGSRTPDIMFSLCYPALSNSSQHYLFKLETPANSRQADGVNPQRVDKVNLQAVGIYIHSSHTSVTAFIAKRSSSPLMRRIQECLETGSRSHLPAFFLVPLVSLSYAVCQWRTVLATIFSHTPNSKYEFDDEKDIKTEFNKLQAFSKNLRDTANFFGTLEPLIDDFEKLSNSLNASATITTSELPAQSSNAGDSRVTERSVQGIQQAFMNLRREVADQHGQLRRIEQRLTRANDAFNHAREAYNTKKLGELLESEAKTLKVIEQLQKVASADASTNTEISRTSMDILIANQKDGRTMMAIAIISALYAPGAYFSSLIGPDIFLVTGSWIGVGPKFWIYLPVTALFMLATILMLWRPEFLWPRCLSRGRGKPDPEKDPGAN